MDASLLDSWHQVGIYLSNQRQIVVLSQVLLTMDISEIFGISYVKQIIKFQAQGYGRVNIDVGLEHRTFGTNLGATTGCIEELELDSYVGLCTHRKHSARESVHYLRQRGVGEF